MYTLTWLQRLSVAQPHQAGVVHLGLDTHPSLFTVPVLFFVGGGAGTHREGRVGVDLILGGDAEAGVAVSGGPRQVHGRLQLVVDLLVDGAPELSAIVSGREHHTSGVNAAAA